MRTKPFNSDPADECVIIHFNSSIAEMAETFSEPFHRIFANYPNDPKRTDITWIIQPPAGIHAEGKIYNLRKRNYFSRSFDRDTRVKLIIRTTGKDAEWFADWIINQVK